MERTLSLYVLVCDFGANDKLESDDLNFDLNFVVYTGSVAQ